MKNTQEELIIVFKKNVTGERSLELVQSFGAKFRKGMDSSRGKIYFYGTGDKYILSFESPEHKTTFLQKKLKFLPEVHEIYEPDWDILKD